MNKGTTLPQLHPLSLQDKEWINTVVFQASTLSADFAFGNMFIWDHLIPQSVMRVENRVITLGQDSVGRFFAYPIGTGPIVPAIQSMHAYADQEGFLFRICGVTEEFREELERTYPNSFCFSEDTAYTDYVYSSEKLSTLSGRKLHKKRNHIHQFEERYPNWRFETMREEHFESCMDLLSKWNRARETNSMGASEMDAVKRAFQYFKPLGLEGGVLFCDEQAAAFSIGERISSDVYLVHFEKADRAFNGAYTMINREFSRQIMQFWPEIRYINREDDLGLESLKQAKLSYYPDFLIKKYTATWKDNKGVYCNGNEQNPASSRTAAASG